MTIPFGEHIIFLMASLQIFVIVTVLLPESFRGGCSFGERIFASLLQQSLHPLCNVYAIFLNIKPET